MQTVGPSVSEQLPKLAPNLRRTVQAARRAVRMIAPEAREVSYRGQPPRSNRAMWKLVRYVVDGRAEYVVAIGAYPGHASLFFPRGRELDDGSGLLEGTGKRFRFITLRDPADIDRPDVKKMLRRAFGG
jgi:hypothetical protein